MARSLTGLLFLIALVPPALGADGEIYRSKDASGATVFSDAPSAGAQKIDVRPTATVPGAPVAAPVPAPQDANAATGPLYDQIAITSPADQETLHSAEGPVQVSISLTPALKTAAGHRMVLRFDGKAVGPPRPDTAFIVKDVERGEHTLQALVVGRDGKTVAESAPVTFYMYQHSKLFTPPPQGKP